MRLSLSSLCLAATLGAALSAPLAGCKGQPSPSGHAGQAPSPRPPADPQVAAGEVAFFKYCALCHGTDARGYAADNAPSLVSETFLASASDVFLARSIREGRPGTAMAGYGRAFGGPLADPEVNAIISYLRARGPALANLPPQPISGVATRGQEIYDRECVRCHGKPAERGSAIHLANTSFQAMASDEFLRFAVTFGRPGTAMRPFVADLAPSQVEDVLSYVRSWTIAPPPQRPLHQPEIPDVPILINPHGGTPKFTVKQDRFVPAAEVKKALEAKNRLVIIDARATSDWHMTRIPGAISIPYYGYDRLDKMPRDGTWILAYCACPHHASGVVVDELRKRGFKNTAVIDEGILEWQKRGYPTESTKPENRPAPGPGLRLTLWMRGGLGG